jgi:hypothetical protein
MEKKDVSSSVFVLAKIASVFLKYFAMFVVALPTFAIGSLLLWISAQWFVYIEPDGLREFAQKSVSGDGSFFYIFLGILFLFLILKSLFIIITPFAYSIIEETGGSIRLLLDGVSSASKKEGEKPKIDAKLISDIQQYLRERQR